MKKLRISYSNERPGEVSEGERGLGGKLRGMGGCYNDLNIWIEGTEWCSFAVREVERKGTEWESARHKFVGNKRFWCEFKRPLQWSECRPMSACFCVLLTETPVKTCNDLTLISSRREHAVDDEKHRQIQHFCSVTCVRAVILQTYLNVTFTYNFLKRFKEQHIWGWR